MSSLIYRAEYANYSFGENHPFSPLRVRMALELLEALGHRVDAIAPEPAPVSYTHLTLPTSDLV